MTTFTAIIYIYIFIRTKLERVKINNTVIWKYSITKYLNFYLNNLIIAIIMQNITIYSSSNLEHNIKN